MLTVSRRGLFALGGTGVAGVALAACGESADQRDQASQDDLLEAELDAEVALAGGYQVAASALGSGAEAATLDDFAAAAEQRAEQLRDLVTDPQAGSDNPPPDGGPETPEALTAAITLANAAIAAHRSGAGLLDSTETRALASSSLIACAAELAAVNSFAGEPEAPRAFVTGGEQEPHEPQTNSETTSTTSESTTTEEP